MPQLVFSRNLSPNEMAFTQILSLPTIFFCFLRKTFSEYLQQQSCFKTKRLLLTLAIPKYITDSSLPLAVLLKIIKTKTHYKKPGVLEVIWNGKAVQSIMQVCRRLAAPYFPSTAFHSPHQDICHRQDSGPHHPRHNLVMSSACTRLSAEWHQLPWCSSQP